MLTTLTLHAFLKRCWYALLVATLLLVCMIVLTFQIRMKTAEDLKRLIEGFSSGADNALTTGFSIRNGLVVQIYSTLMQQSIIKTINA